VTINQVMVATVCFRSDVTTPYTESQQYFSYIHNENKFTINTKVALAWCHWKRRCQI